MKKTQKQAIAVGASLAAVAAAAAGVYFFTGKNAKNRKKVSKWANDMQNDIVKELNKAGKHTKASYQEIVDKVAKNYKGLKSVSTAELAEIAQELKGHWDTISEVSKASNVVKKTVKKAAAKSPIKKAVKKAAKTVAKKAAKKVATKKARR